MAKTTFLESAAKILDEIGKPLSAKQIISLGKEQGIVLTNGLSPDATLRAKLSIELRNKKTISIFQRTGPNRFALRKWGLPEYEARPFIKEIPEEISACIDTHNFFNNINYFVGFINHTNSIENYIGKPEKITFLNRKIAEENTMYKQLIAYTIIENENSGEILCYRRGKYTNSHKMLQGQLCVGFGGHIIYEDANDLFGTANAGAKLAAAREIYEEIGIIIKNEIAIIGFVNDDSSIEGIKHLGIVLKVAISEEEIKNIANTEKSINQIQLINEKQAANKFYDFEFWSQLVLKNAYKHVNFENIILIRPKKKAPNINVFVIIGEIASGKSTLAKLMEDEFKCKIVSTRNCVAELIKIDDFGTKERKEFQSAASELIKTTVGMRRLANKIAEKVEKNQLSVIDGIRHHYTLKCLREIFQNLCVIYIESPIDKSFYNYFNRANRQPNIEEFRNARWHPVEREVKLLRNQADVYIFNNGDLEDLKEEFRKWWLENL